ncbi:lipoprotein-anchoring transpeptidase ErfK/SrfK [Streptomyces olivoverticillatus]|uniref:Lipoprotein-anchoring transpeptidase ErfK/SrfK n=1 Tax=Streptomyces olivoverticillatus TaxID=66427 RepID=A0A7W7LKC6_9ACTN|nr:Ig-like domain-containing protein [Streptomyces olivoverticillatus]MBB4891196.1 lipoprotein-anchoring transpeptidase ErfK/SrfK [Streptomyces olivoverticillatus]
MRPVRRPALAARLATLVALVALAGCTSVAPRTAVTDDARPSGELIRVLPRDRAEGVQATDRLEVRAPRGRLEGVQVTEVHQGISRTVPGRISADGHDWRPESAGDAPRLGSRYTVDVVARDPSGRRSRRHTGFSTYAPSQRFIGYFTPEPQSTVGTGMIVSFSFDRPIADRAAVERAVRITARPATEVVGHWFGNDRLDFRPRHYWRAGTRVTMDLRLRDVRGAEGVYGLQRKTVAFTVGRDQTSTVDAAAHTMRVVRDGKPLAILPITAGAQGTETYNGKMVISQKFNVTRMNGNTVGFGGEYDISDVPHAMRLTASGTFLHGNYWAGPGTFGVLNTSHGCIGLRDEQGGNPSSPAGWFYGSSLVGDVVEVVHSAERVVAPDNGLSGWNMPWGAWRAGSALGGGGAR